MDLLRVAKVGDRAYRLSGELDLSTVHSLHFLELVPPDGDVVLDLANLRFIDASGLECLSRIARHIFGKLIVRNARMPVEKLIRKTASREQLDNVLLPGNSAVDEVDELEGSPCEALVTRNTPESLCRALVARAARELGPWRFAHLAVWEHGEPCITAFSHQVGRVLHEVQMSSGQGPALEALYSRATSQSASLIEERRWREFTNNALYEGVASVACIPLVLDGEVFGVLSLYGQKEQSFDEELIGRMRRIASEDASAIFNALAYWNATELVRQLQEALESRAVIDQAKGVLMAREGMTADQAFRTLRRASQRGNLKVRELARRVVEEAVRSQRAAGQQHSSTVNGVLEGGTILH